MAQIKWKTKAETEQEKAIEEQLRLEINQEKINEKNRISDLEMALAEMLGGGF